MNKLKYVLLFIMSSSVMSSWALIAQCTDAGGNNTKTQVCCKPPVSKATWFQPRQGIDCFGNTTSSKDCSQTLTYRDFQIDEGQDYAECPKGVVYRR